MGLQESVNTLTSNGLTSLTPTESSLLCSNPKQILSVEAITFKSSQQTSVRAFELYISYASSISLADPLFNMAGSPPYHKRH